MKEKLETAKLMFTRFTTQFLLLDSIAHLLYNGKDAKIAALEVFMIIAVSSVCAFIYAVLLTAGEVSKKVMSVLQISYFIIINTIVLAVGLCLKLISFTNIKTFIIFESFTVGSIIITILYSYRNSSGMAKRMNEKLKKLEEEIN